LLKAVPSLAVLLKAYHSAGLRWGTVTSKFYETRDNL
jgi:phosphoglycolate phosphatase-like HAD superfamily hydrolase